MVSQPTELGSRETDFALDEITSAEGVSLAMRSLLTDRLALLAGAGLSMAPPSSLPSAAELARLAKEKHDALFCPPDAPLSANIEEQAQYFFERDQLATVYFRTLIDQNAFAAPPNPGHYAVADLLLVRAIQTAMTTNVDSMIETAGKMLFGQIASAIDGISAATFPPNISPLLKLHGCRDTDQRNMVWAPGQLNAEPVAQRIESSKEWLHGRLTDRDLLIVGFSTDWDYLNALLLATLGAANPASVLVIDLGPAEAFVEKAPELFALGRRTGVNFKYVRASGADFLGSLRQSFSRSFVRRVLVAGAELFQQHYGIPPDPRWTEAPALSNIELWRVRRDFEGRAPNSPASERNPTAGPLLGFTVLQLQAKGATPEGNHWLIDGRRVRVVRGEGKALHNVVVAFSREIAAPITPDIVIAVGAGDVGLPANILRSGTVSTVARAAPGRWVTREAAVEEFGL